MPVNDNKPPSSEDFNRVFNTLLNGFLSPTASQKTSEPTVDPVAEVNRLLKKAEEIPSRASDLIQIADRHIRIIELALAYQK